MPGPDAGHDHSIAEGAEDRRKFRASVLARLRSFLTALIFRRRMERDMAEEWQFHLDARTEDLVAAGVPVRRSDPVETVGPRSAGAAIHR
ncbi:MAG: hypothetical protein DMF97_19060 [Acidobacteria bacterium]|nr:MAG: hypothetical protein DMF97_19060 [Acidobacteriota bacterium]